jgi:nitroreductase
MEYLIDIIKGRRSVRKYETKPVTEAQLEQLMEAVRWSPSWANTQCWEIIIVRESSQKKALQECLPPKGNPAVKAVVQAPVVIALCAKARNSGFYNGVAVTKYGDWCMYDLGIATQNLCLSAYAMGLGTVIIGMFDHDEAARLLELPPGYRVVTLIPLGYPAKTGKPPKRREIQDFTHNEKYAKAVV